MSTTAPTLTEILLQRVANRTGRRVNNLAIEVESDCVVLRGRVNSYHIKQLAQTGAREVVPNGRIDNAIVVE